MNEKYVIYTRVSTEEQRKSGLGLEAQDRDITLYLERYAVPGYEVVARFRDIQSGMSDIRPEFLNAVETAKHEKATLLVSKLDRLSRSVVVLATLVADKALTLKVAQMPNAEKFQLHIYAALAEQEREFISTRTRAALAAAKARGQKLGGLRAGTLIRNEQSSRAANEWVNVHIAPWLNSWMPITDEAAAHALNAHNLTTRNGFPWTKLAVARVRKRLYKTA